MDLVLIQSHMVTRIVLLMEMVLILTVLVGDSDLDLDYCFVPHSNSYCYHKCSRLHADLYFGSETDTDSIVHHNLDGMYANIIQNDMVYKSLQDYILNCCRGHIWRLVVQRRSHYCMLLDLVAVYLDTADTRFDIINYFNSQCISPPPAY